MRDVASITHRNDEAITGAVAVVAAMQRLAGGQSGRDVLTALIAKLPDTALSDSLAALAALLDAVRSGGDTDTMASLAAQLRAAAGDDIPAGWLPHLPTSEVRELTDALVRSRSRGGAPRRRGWGFF